MSFFCASQDHRVAVVMASQCLCIGTVTMFGAKRRQYLLMGWSTRLARANARGRKIHAENGHMETKSLINRLDYNLVTPTNSLAPPTVNLIK